MKAFASAGCVGQIEPGFAKTVAIRIRADQTVKENVYDLGIFGIRVER
jgi:hypothetical protein